MTLNEIDPVIFGVWDYLIHVSEKEILALPDLAVGQSIDEFLQLPQEARWLIGFWLNRGSAVPKKTKTAFSARTERQQLTWSDRARTRIAAQLKGIRHWKVTLGGYDSISNAIATWFVDPPYMDKGRYYRMRDVDYPRLAEWCATRDGRVIVCEQAGAAWLPFEPLATIKSTRGTSQEVVWVRG